MKTKYIRTARVNKQLTEIRYNHLTGFNDAIKGDYYTVVESKTFETLAEAQKRLDNEVEFLYIETVKILVSADMNRKIAALLGILKETFGDCI